LPRRVKMPSPTSRSLDQAEIRGQVLRNCHRRTHIRYDDASGGGHGSGAGKAKAAFPANCTDDEIIDAIEGIANGPASTQSVRLTGASRGSAFAETCPSGS
jgi:hypothetical protein